VGRAELDDTSRPEAVHQIGAMNLREAPRKDIAALAFAAASIPVTKMALMFWEYRLHLPLLPFIEPAALLLALGVAIVTASYFPRSWVTRLFRVAAIVVWSGLAYFIVAFVPGCMWAPACL
jgi:hypothetical protein